MDKDKFLINTKKLIYFLMGIQVLIGLIFIIKNINFIPNYGDTKEFIELAKTMQLDSFRPFIYPVMLRGLINISNFLNINLPCITYIIQIILNCFACFILIKTLKALFSLNINKAEIVLYTLFLLTIPINLHFNMSIKCDSISTSFTILFICYLTTFLLEGKSKYIVYSIVTMFITNNIRSERIYFLAFVICSAIFIELFYYIKKNKSDINKKKIIGLLLILIIGITSSRVAQLFFQNNQITNREASIIKFAYERIVGNTLPEIYEYLPDYIKDDISYDEAIQAASDRNFYVNPYNKLLSIDGNHDRIQEVMLVAIRRNGPDIINNSLSDFFKNIFSPYYLLVNNIDWSYNYTISRMQGEHYLFTDAYILYYTIIFVIINIYVIFKIKLKKETILIKKEIMIAILYTIASSAFFALLTSQNFHIRYVMPIYIIEIAILIVNLNISRD